MKTRPVFESFSDFVYSITKAINEASSPEKGGNVDFLNNKLGGIKMSEKDKNELKVIVDYLNKMMVKGSASSLEEYSETIASFYTSKEAGVKTGSLSIVKQSNPIEYKYLISGTVRVKGLPGLYDDDSVNMDQRYTEDEDVQTIPASDLLRILAEYNIGVWAKMVEEGKTSEKAFKGANGGKKGKGDYKYPFLTIDPSGDKTEILQVVPYEGRWDASWSKKSEKHVGSEVVSEAEYGIRFPVFVPEKITPEFGAKLGISYFEDVVYPPAGNSKEEEVKDKEFSSSGKQFFEENKIVISAEGIADIKALISEFNSISLIKVNGGASSKPTSRTGGNQQLATDRMNAGIAELNKLKKEGVEQLKNATIEKGEAKVQDAAEESDPKNQQVSFIVTGMVKSTSTVTDDPAPVIIKKSADRKADELVIRSYHFYLAWDVKK
jgi:hypothetical protein